ncbi:alpha/beta hydrolase [Solimicrobium silvestre]|uniref:Lysophospholipase n=1 Tax=Solimicrobium silvestre TaxID=2099400 RepID=A0A2S9H005_9BURK|nr:alpha/beta hydrolase [Solimicrobium silvestre]PRC93314.1 Lysophospholipase [Solimicrobium silvestre]
MVGAHESRLSMADGTELFIRDWLIEGETQSCIVILHGLGEHCGRYNHVAAFLNSCGFSVRTYDHRGHGQSTGARGDIPDLLAIVHDAEIIINEFAQHCQTRPILLGHSMGGLFAARVATAANIPLSGLILSSPALALRLSKIEKILLSVMSSIAPHFAISNGLKPALLSHDPAVMTAYENDPLVHKKITASLLNGMFAAIEFAQTRAPILDIPTLLLVAEADQLVDPQGSHDFFESLPSNLGTAHFYTDFYHEIFNEVGAADVFHDLQTWLAARHFST